MGARGIAAFGVGRCGFTYEFLGIYLFKVQALKFCKEGKVQIVPLHPLRVVHARHVAEPAELLAAASSD